MIIQIIMPVVCFVKRSDKKDQSISIISQTGEVLSTDISFGGRILDLLSF
jgi:hypothetical protein